MDSRHFQTGGFTITVNSDIPFNSGTFHPKFIPFEAADSGEQRIVINHFFLKKLHIGKCRKERLYSMKPWEIYRLENDKILYEWMSTKLSGSTFLRKIIANTDHTRLDIYNDALMKKIFNKGSVQDITLLPTDQILLSRVLGYHQGCLVHSLGMIISGNGYLFIGHSGAGKTTLAKMLRSDATVLCDDRNIIRKQDGVHRVYGTWKYSELEEISPESAPLKGIFFINQASYNRIVPISDFKLSLYLIMDHLVKSLVTRDWMEATLDFIENLSRQTKCYHLYFDKSGTISELINQLSVKDK